MGMINSHNKNYCMISVEQIIKLKEKMKMKRALTAREDTNMYGGAHATNADVAQKAAQEGRDIVVHGQHYDGQRYHYYKYRVTDIQILPDGNIIGTTDNGDAWQATAEMCEYATSGQI